MPNPAAASAGCNIPLIPKEMMPLAMKDASQNVMDLKPQALFCVLIAVCTIFKPSPFLFLF